MADITTKENVIDLPWMQRYDAGVKKQMAQSTADIKAAREEVESVSAEALAELNGRMEGMNERLKNLGEVKALKIDAENGYQVCGMDWLTIGEGAPSIVPTAKGLLYFDKTNRVLYVSVSVNNATADWVALA